MPNIDLSHINIDKLLLPAFVNNGVEADVLRLDKIHPLISGNKWFKLRYYLEDAKQQHKKAIVTFGGAWSNHIIATAAASELYGFRSIGIIRGEEPGAPSPTLVQAKAMGMELFFTSREDYKEKKLPFTMNEDSYLINEGGYGIKGAEGAAGILDHCQKENYSHICCAAGTGTMAAGLANAAATGTVIIAVSVMKNNTGMESSISSLLNGNKKQIMVIHDHHFGGYAKQQPALIDFINGLYRETGIPTDFVYTGKLFFAITELALKKYFPPGSRILLIHSGGLQGNSSLDKGTLIF